MEFLILTIVLICAGGYLVWHFKKSIEKGECGSCSGNCSSCSIKNVKKEV